LTSLQIREHAAMPVQTQKPAGRPDAHETSTASSIPPPRVVIEAVWPEIDGGRFPIKRVVGEPVDVEADIFAEGHDEIAAVLRYRPASAPNWSEVRMNPLENDRWAGRFVPTSVGWFEYTIEAWVDHFATAVRGLSKKWEAGQEVGLELREIAGLVRAGADRAVGDEARRLRDLADALEHPGDPVVRIELALSTELRGLMDRHSDRRQARRLERVLRVQVERERARFGAWYELFPRSTAAEPNRHGRFADLQRWMGYIASMGFDVVYLPPIHPIGRTHRKGPNNSLTPGPGDPGSPWAIGGPEGGHTAIHPELGTLDDFRRLVAAAAGYGLEIALDIAFQCSPDHPWVREHPEWFKRRPDGSIQYAENPPKKYQDIYPLNFETEAWRSLWEALRDVFLYWIDQGVKIFRVDNPHTKALPFWEWCLREVWDRHSDTVFLSEAFTRPKLMKYLAKAGFTQSYTYFTWRNDKQGLTDYFTELTRSECAEYMRPNLFANTPDILHEYLQTGGRPAFITRLVLAATLGASYGIYGPPFELCVGTPVRPGSEEYLDSEKYQIRHWDLDAPWSLRDLIGRVNTIRRLNPALQENRNLRFVAVDNPQLIAYTKATPDLANVILTVVNLDPFHTQSGWLSLPLHELRIDGGDAAVYQVHDLINDARYTWRGPTNFVLLNPHHMPAHIFRVRRRIRAEQDYEYFE
jgi:starch synthase (maltosyl-transferring)